MAQGFLEYKANFRTPHKHRILIPMAACIISETPSRSSPRSWRNIYRLRSVHGSESLHRPTQTNASHLVYPHLVYHLDKCEINSSTRVLQVHCFWFGLSFTCSYTFTSISIRFLMALYYLIFNTNNWSEDVDCDVGIEVGTTPYISDQIHKPVREKGELTTGH